MHPILFRIPLPQMPLKAWWAAVLVAAICAIYGLISMRRQDRNSAAVALVVAIGAGVLGYVFRETTVNPQNLPIYSYGVMLGGSLVVGWYLTLTLADRDGLPKETMANCYVITALAAIAGSRILYVATNPDEFKELADVFALRKGGLAVYGGFIGGYLGSWAYLRSKKINLMPWADVAVPSLASGLMITRIGCYLFGCDFGTRLPESAPAFLKKMGTFPHWTGPMFDGTDGSPAFKRHVDLFRGTPLGMAIEKADASLPVHPTQIYESLCGLLLLVILLWQRKNQKFRGQIFFLFAFGYGALRFLLEIVRDDTERGEWGPMMGQHLLVPGALLLMAVGFSFGIALGIKNPQARNIARALSFVPAIAAYFVLKPASFGQTIAVQLSTSQWIGLLSALLVSYFYAKRWEEARKKPALAMSLASLGDGARDADEPDANVNEKKKTKKAKAASPDEEHAKKKDARDREEERELERDKKTDAEPADKEDAAAENDEDEDEEDDADGEDETEASEAKVAKKESAKADEKAEKKAESAKAEPSEPKKSDDEKSGG